jgi:hypothetical protein
MQPALHPSLTLTSARDARSQAPEKDRQGTYAAGFFTRLPALLRNRFFQHRARSSAWRWVAFVYLIVALAAPQLVYSGPDVLSPVVPVIAGEALDGDLPAHLRAGVH